MLIVEAALLEPKTQIAGTNILIDLEGLSLQHVWQFSPGIAKIILEYVQVQSSFQRTFFEHNWAKMSYT